MKLEEIVKIYKETQKPRTAPPNRTDWGLVSANTAFRQDGNIRAMADMLVKLTEFEVTEEWAERVMLSLLSKEDRELIIEEGGCSSYIRAKCRAEYQAVIDQLREDLCK